MDRQLLRLGYRAEHAKPAMDAIAWELVRIQREQFASQGGRSGGWQPRKIFGDGHPILDDTGDLKESFKYGDEMNIWEVTDESVNFGSRDPKGVHHQYGTKNMAQRKVMDLTEQDKSGLMKISQAWVLTGSLPL